MNKLNTYVILSVASLLGVSSAYAQLSITTAGVSSVTIDFQTSIGHDGITEPASATGADPTSGDNVIKFRSTGNRRLMLERENGAWLETWNNDHGLSADAWSFSKSGFNIGLGAGVPSQFGDFNNDGDLIDRVDSNSTINGLGWANRNELGIGAADDFGIYLGTNGSFASPFASFSMTLKVVNNSGIALGGGPLTWDVNVGTWYRDNDTGNATISLAWSTDNATWTTVDSYTTTNVGLVSTSRPLSASIVASVAPGDNFYLRVANTLNGGSGAGVFVDDWNVSVVPEPSFYAALFAGLALAVGVVRRKLK